MYERKASENVDGTVIGPRLLRKRQKISGCSMDGEDDKEEGIDFPRISPEPVLESVENPAFEAPEPEDFSVSFPVEPAPEPENFPPVSFPDSTPETAIETPAAPEVVDKITLESKKAKLHRYILENIIRDNNCVSMKTLTAVYGFDGNKKRKRHYVKKIIEDDFSGQVTFISIVNEPQVVSRCDAQSSGEIFPGDCHDQILKQAAQILRERVDDFITKEKERLICSEI